MTRSPSPDDHHQKRKRSLTPSNNDQSPPPTNRTRLSPKVAFERININIPRIVDDDPIRKREREEQLRIRLVENELAGVVKPKVDPKMEMQKMAATRGGGAYIPPAKLKAMQAELELNDPSSPEYQRMRWDALRKSINGLINKVNVANIKFIVPELFGENLIRGRGVFCRSIMRAQSSSLPFTPVFAALVSIINTKLPTLGELLLTRVVSQFRRAYRRNDKITCISTTIFIAQLVNQQVAHHLLAFEMIILLLEKPTDDSVEIAVGFTKQVGAFLSEAEPQANNSVYERFRSILHEASISKRVQYMIEVLFQVRKDRFKDNPVLPEGLDLVEDDDIITHPIHLDDELQVQEGLNVFKLDPDYEENEEKYTSIKNEILGLDSDSDASGSESGSDESSESEAEPDTGIIDGKVEIHDHTGTNLINFRRNIYLTIMSSIDFEEAAHKLLKSNIEDGLEIELANMIVECCSQERSFAKFYGLLGERFCKLNQNWTMTFEQCFRNYYDTIHRFETNRLRNIARFFGHLLAQDAIPWTVFEVIKMNEDDTTSSSRIFVKIMFQELSEVLGLKGLAQRFKDPAMLVWFTGLFPVDNPKNTRFSINYFTSIGLGVLTEEMREHLKRAPQIIMAKRRELEDAESSSDSDDSSSILSTSENSDSDDSDSYSSSSDASSDFHRPRNDRQTSGHRRIRESSEPKRRSERRHASRSPVRRGSRRESPSPVRRRYDSPESVHRGTRRDSPEPARRGSRRDSPSPARRRRDSAEPVRRESRRRSPSPVRRRRHSPEPIRRGALRESPSPVRRRRDSPEPDRRESRRDSPSPAPRRRDPTEPVRRGPRRNSPSPLRRTRRESASPVHRSTHRDSSSSPVRQKATPRRNNGRSSASPVDRDLRRRDSGSGGGRYQSPAPRSGSQRVRYDRRGDRRRAERSVSADEPRYRSKPYEEEARNDSGWHKRRDERSEDRAPTRPSVPSPAPARRTRDEQPRVDGKDRFSPSPVSTVTKSRMMINPARAAMMGR